MESIAATNGSTVSTFADLSVGDDRRASFVPAAPDVASGVDFQHLGRDRSHDLLSYALGGGMHIASPQKKMKRSHFPTRNSSPRSATSMKRSSVCMDTDLRNTVIDKVIGNGPTGSEFDPELRLPAGSAGGSSDDHQVAGMGPTQAAAAVTAVAPTAAVAQSPETYMMEPVLSLKQASRRQLRKRQPPHPKQKERPTQGQRNRERRKVSPTQTDREAGALGRSLRLVTGRSDYDDLRRNCDYCVRKKVKCNGEFPCSMCVRKQVECEFSVKQKPGPKVKLLDERRDQQCRSCLSLRILSPSPSSPPPPPPASEHRQHLEEQQKHLDGRFQGLEVRHSRVMLLQQQQVQQEELLPQSHGHQASGDAYPYAQSRRFPPNYFSPSRSSRGSASSNGECATGGGGSAGSGNVSAGMSTHGSLFSTPPYLSKTDSNRHCKNGTASSLVLEHGIKGVTSMTCISHPLPPPLGNAGGAQNPSDREWSHPRLNKNPTTEGLPTSTQLGFRDVGLPPEDAGGYASYAPSGPEKDKTSQRFELSSGGYFKSGNTAGRNTHTCSKNSDGQRRVVTPGAHGYCEGKGRLRGQAIKDVSRDERKWRENQREQWNQSQSLAEGQSHDPNHDPNCGQSYGQNHDPNHGQNRAQTNSQNQGQDQDQGWNQSQNHEHRHFSGGISSVEPMTSEVDSCPTGAASAPRAVKSCSCPNAFPPPRFPPRFPSPFLHVGNFIHSCLSQVTDSVQALLALRCAPFFGQPELTSIAFGDKN